MHPVLDGLHWLLILQRNHYLSRPKWVEHPEISERKLRVLPNFMEP